MWLPLQEQQEPQQLRKKELQQLRLWFNGNSRRGILMSSTVTHLANAVRVYVSGVYPGLPLEEFELNSGRGIRVLAWIVENILNLSQTFGSQCCVKWEWEKLLYSLLSLSPSLSFFLYLYEITNLRYNRASTSGRGTVQQCGLQAARRKKTAKID